MAVLDRNISIKNLQKKGFIKRETHHSYYDYYHDGKLIAYTYTSHSKKDLDSYLISQMSRQCGMPKSFFVDFCRCTKSQEDYVQLLIDNEEI